VPEPRRVDRVLQVHAELEQVEQHLQVALRLDRAPITPKASHGSWAPSGPGWVTNPGIRVWNGRLFGPTVLGKPLLAS